MFKGNVILIGLGSEGGRVLAAFKERLAKEFPKETLATLPIGCLYIDTSNRQEEILRFDFLSYQCITDKRNVAHLAFNHPDLQRGTKNRYINALDRIQGKLQRLSASSCNYIYIIAGADDDAWSGILPDIILQTRLRFQDGDFRYDIGTCIIPCCKIPDITPPPGYDSCLYDNASAYATLTELNALLTGNLPMDIFNLSGRELETLKSARSLVNGVYVYSDRDESGQWINGNQVMSDFLYSSIFSPCDDNRAITFESLPEPIEYYEKSKDGYIFPWRIKTVGAFGVKRYEIPEKEIQEYLTLSLGRQALLQLLYNNWDDDSGGFRDVPARVDWSSYVKGHDRKLGNPLEDWRFTDRHVILDLPILPSEEGHWVSFGTYWNRVLPRWIEDAQYTKRPIDELDKLCKKGLATGFRCYGVANFFAEKKVFNYRYADEIASRMEADIFDKWAKGTFSLHSLLELYVAIIEETQSRIGQMEERAVKLGQLLERLEAERRIKADEYNRAGFFRKALKGKQMLADYGEIMQKICLRTTELEGAGFAIDMMKELVREENILRSRIVRFIETVNYVINGADRQIEVLWQKIGPNNFDETVIRDYDRPTKVREFAFMVIQNKKHQVNINGEVRREILKFIGAEHTFARVNHALDEEVLTDIIQRTVKEKVMLIHDNTLIEKHEKLWGRNILEVLSEKYTSTDEIRSFAYNLIKSCKPAVKFNSTEIFRNVPNNVQTTVGGTVFRRYIQVYMPKIEGDERVQRFAKNLKTALENSTDGSISVHVDMSSDNPSVIEAISFVSDFPFRCLADVKTYKERYESLIDHGSNALTTIHISDFSNTPLPNLFIEEPPTKSKLKQTYLHVMLIATALGIISKREVAGSDSESFCRVEIDELLGFETMRPLADSYDGIFQSDSFTEQFCEEIEDEVSLKLASVADRTALKSHIEELLHDVIYPEIGVDTNIASQYANATREALEILASAE